QMLLHKNNRLSLDLDEILLAIHNMDLGHKPPSTTSIVELIIKIDNQTTELGEHIKYCQVLYNKDDSEVKHFEEIKKSISELTKRTRMFVDMWQSRKTKEDILHYYQKNIHGYAEENQNLLKVQYNQSLSEVKEQQEHFRTLLSKTQKIIAVSAVIILILIFTIVHRTAKFISTPLEKLKNQAISISKGNYDVKINATSKDEIGQLAEAFNLMSDTISKEMTGRKQAEDAQRRSQKMDAIGQLTGGIAHDFNNLLGIILGNIDFLERHLTLDEQSNKFIAPIRRASKRAADLTKQLLSFSRDKTALPMVTDINQVINEMDSLVARSLTPEIEVVYQLDENLWPTEIDSGDFEDSLLNLSINARDAMAGHGQITIETRNVTLDAAYCTKNPNIIPGEYVELSVSDSGEGIPQNQRERIFEPFYTTKEQGKGTGLGLAMAYGFVKRSGGDINVYSEQGIGTTFRLYLPRTYSNKEPTLLESSQPEVLPKGHETILVVDDEADLLEIARESLEILGYRVLTAINGSQALDCLAEEPSIDLLFSDVVMPGDINGYELAELATINHPKLKVVLTSGYTGKAVAYNGQARFNTNLLSKPYSQAELAKRMRKILDGLG
ncbi:MAG: ATP-binding protein, partial [Chromatiales bacterium]|nr:ATP-binding protein [Chromatiales bacterium]